MIAQGSAGSVVSIASVTAKTGATQLTHYAATKAAVLGTTVNGAVALEKYGICFNAVSPGTISTAIHAADPAAPNELPWRVEFQWGDWECRQKLRSR